MANPTLTYGHGILDDFHTAWSTRNATNIAAGEWSATVEYDDWFKITATFNEGATEEYGYYEYDASSLSLATNTYQYFLMRYKTSLGEDGARAQAAVTHTAGGTWDWILTSPSYSTTWKWVVKQLTPNKTCDKIRLYIWDDGTDGTFDVWYDFAFIYKNVFTFPIHPQMEFTIPPRFSDIPVFGRVGGETQWAGSDLATVRLSGDMELTDEWGTPKGDTFYMIAHDTYTEPWQWFTSTRGNFKVTMRPLTFIDEEGEGAKPRYMLELKELRRSCASHESHLERFGLV